MSFRVFKNALLGILFCNVYAHAATPLTEDLEQVWGLALPEMHQGFLKDITTDKKPCFYFGEGYMAIYLFLDRHSMEAHDPTVDPIKDKLYDLSHKAFDYCNDPKASRFEIQPLFDDTQAAVENYVKLNDPEFYKKIHNIKGL